MRRLGVIAITCVGLFAFWQSTSYLSFISIGFGGDIGQVLAAVVPAAVAFGAALLLILRRWDLAEWLFDDEPVDIVVYPIPVLRAALIVVGVGLVARSAASTASVLAFVAAARSEQLGAAASAEQIVGPAVSLVAGIAIVMLSRQLSSSLWSLGLTGTSSADTEQQCPACGKSYDPGDYRQDSDARCVDCGEQLPLPGA